MLRKTYLLIQILCKKSNLNNYREKSYYFDHNIYDNKTIYLQYKQYINIYLSLKIQNIGNIKRVNIFSHGLNV